MTLKMDPILIRLFHDLFYIEHTKSEIHNCYVFIKVIMEVTN
jgi:hypothetical protein